MWCRDCRKSRADSATSWSGERASAGRRDTHRRRAFGSGSRTPSPRIATRLADLDDRLAVAQPLVEHPALAARAGCRNADSRALGSSNVPESPLPSTSRATRARADRRSRGPSVIELERHAGLLLDDLASSTSCGPSSGAARRSRRSTCSAGRSAGLERLLERLCRPDDTGSRRFRQLPKRMRGALFSSRLIAGPAEVPGEPHEHREPADDQDNLPRRRAYLCATSTWAACAATDTVDSDTAPATRTSAANNRSRAKLLRWRVAMVVESGHAGPFFTDGASMRASSCAALPDQRQVAALSQRLSLLRRFGPVADEHRPVAPAHCHRQPVRRCPTISAFGHRRVGLAHDGSNDRDRLVDLDDALTKPQIVHIT